MKPIPAIFENGVFRPTEPVQLPEHTLVFVEPQSNGGAVTSGDAPSEGMTKVYAILGERYDSGHTDTAARHNEHQP